MYNFITASFKYFPLQIEFYGDFDGSFHKSLQLDTDLSAALLGTRAKRYDLKFQLYLYWDCLEIVIKL